MDKELQIVQNEAEMLSFGAELAANSQGGDVIYLEGELGAGKTTLARGFLRKKGIKETIKSPTYTIVEPYQIDQQLIYHFDLYRLANPIELLDMGIEDYFTDDAICLIEWPEKGRGILKAPSSHYHIRACAAGREIILRQSGNPSRMHIPNALES